MLLASAAGLGCGVATAPLLRLSLTPTPRSGVLRGTGSSGSGVAAASEGGPRSMSVRSPSFASSTDGCCGCAAPTDGPDAAPDASVLADPGGGGLMRVAALLAVAVSQHACNDRLRGGALALGLAVCCDVEGARVNTCTR